MFNNSLTFHTSGSRRTILVVDDELVNRELLRMILEKDYVLLFAENGEEALGIIRDKKEKLSLVLLDLLMPKMSGTEVLKVLREDKELRRVPVIVLTSDQDAEIESLGLGAIDFIPKPYPRPDVIMARVVRTIELSEDRQIINSTERDPLTKLYNREYFYRYAEQFDQYHADMEMDAIVLDVNHFHLINERYGRPCGDGVLSRIGKALRELVGENSCMACRGEADSFYVYRPHSGECGPLLEQASRYMNDDAALANTRVHLRMGVYSAADKTIDIERRFDRAKQAADTVRNNYTQNIAFYDNAFHEAEIYREQLTEDFWEAIKEKQFLVYYQPKFDIRGEKPVLSSAEALVRWQHPRLGLVSPGVFIPLFEKNGMIQQLDRYVWREAAARIQEWKERFGVSLPVSVNVSRVDMFDTALADMFRDILEEYSLWPDELLLEITESAYMDDSELIMNAVQQFRSMGLRIEMDDFGTGYSSLGMLSKLPIDVLKLDMIFIRNAFGERRDVKMLELVISIAEHLGVPVVAEGVETGEQLRALKSMGCDYVQGYYFSKPLPADEFERYLHPDRHEELPLFSEEDDGEDTAVAGNDAAGGIDLLRPSDPAVLKDFLEKTSARVYFTRAAKTLAGDYFALYCVDLDTGCFSEIRSDEGHRWLGMESCGENFFALGRRNARRSMEGDDLDFFLSLFTPENFTKELDEGGTFTMNYRIALAGKPTYVSMKARRLGENENLIVVGICNIDIQTRKEQEIIRAREAAFRDSLTGVKSREAFQKAGRIWNDRIVTEDGVSFAVVSFDVDRLRSINESLGLKAGDSSIRDVSALICNTFKRSPVYRIGGDEFAVILTGADYEKRAELMEAMRAANLDRVETGEPLVSCGIAEYQAHTDKSFQDVFHRADMEMREGKPAT